MKRQIFLFPLLFALILSIQAQSQEHEDYTALKKSPQYIKCILVTHDRDSIPALMENHREPYKRYGDKKGKIDLVLSTEGRQTLKAEEFIAYELTLRNKKKVQFYSVDGQIVTIKINGESIKLFEREEFVIRAPKHAILVNPNVRKRYLVRKKYEAYLTDVDDIAEQDLLLEYFEDCPALQTPLKQGRLKARDIVKLVQRYESCDNKSGY